MRAAQTSENQNSRFAHSLLKIFISLGLLYFILTKVEWGRLQDTLAQLDLFLLITALVGFAATIVLEVLQLKTVFYRLNISVFKLASMHFKGVAFTYILPGQLGSDLYKYSALVKESDDARYPAILLFSLRFCALIIVGLAFLISLYIHHDMILSLYRRISLTFDYEVVVPITFTILVIFGFWIKFIKKPSKYQSLPVVRTALEEVIPVAFTIATIAIGILLARMFLFYFLALAVGVELSGSFLLLLVSTSTLATVIPISVAGLGVRESSIIGILLAFDVAYNPAVLIALISRTFMLLAAFVGCTLLFTSRGY